MLVVAIQTNCGVLPHYVDATDESVAETEGEAVAGLGEEGVGFSVEDLTDLEEDGDTTTGTASPSAVDYLPPYPLPCDSGIACV